MTDTFKKALAYLAITPLILSAILALIVLSPLILMVWVVRWGLDTLGAGK